MYAGKKMLSYGITVFALMQAYGITVFAYTLLTELYIKYIIIINLNVFIYVNYRNTVKNSIKNANI